MTTGERIRHRRKELGMAQTELADRMGYRNVSTVSKIECGINNISVKKLNKFAKVLKTTTAYLMGYEEEKEMKTTTTCSPVEELARVAGIEKEFKAMNEVLDAILPLNDKELKAVMCSALDIYALKHRGNSLEIAANITGAIANTPKLSIDRLIKEMFEDEDDEEDDE